LCATLILSDALVEQQGGRKQKAEITPEAGRKLNKNGLLRDDEYEQEEIVSR
jgi:hypothetical protein